MLRTKLATSVLLCVSLQGGMLDGIINDQINSILTGGKFTSLVNIQCNDFYPNIPDIRFSIAGCPIQLSSQECYGQTINSIKKLFSSSGKRFDRDEICNSILDLEKKIIANTLPTDESNSAKYISLPANRLEHEEIISQEKGLLASPILTAPRNANGLRGQIAKETDLLCSLSLNRDSCILSKSIGFAKKARELSSKKANEAFSAFNQDRYIANANMYDVDEATEEIRKKLPVELQAAYLQKGQKYRAIEALSMSHSSMLIDIEEVFFEKYSEVIARSVPVPSRDISSVLSLQSSAGVMMP